MLLERLDEVTATVSLAEDVNFLKVLKQHCALPTAESFTEYDELLKVYTNHAEKFVDKHMGVPYRPKQFRLNLSATPIANSSTPTRALDVFNQPFTTIRLPFGPIDTDPEVVYVDVDDDETAITEFTVAGQFSHSPEIILKKAFVWPTVELGPYPIRVTFTTSANKTNDTQLLAIHMLASYCYRNPEGMGEEVPQVGSHFWAMITSEKESFL